MRTTLFFSALSWLLCWSSLLLADSGKVPAPERPNILLAFGDDLGANAAVYARPGLDYGNRLLTTPAMDRVAREGALFWNAFVSVPSCTPSRAAVISGRHFFRNGSHSQLHYPWDGDPATDPWRNVRGFGLMLQDSGYHIGWTYKMHISPDRMGGDRRNYRPAGSRFNQFSQNVSKAEDREAAKRQLLEEVRTNFRAFLADRKPGQPFFYWFNPTNTHRKWERGSGRAIWGLDPGDLEGQMPPYLPDSPEVREDFSDYLGEVMAFDAALQVLIEELEQLGELDRTLLTVSGDHGAPGFPRGKCHLYDFGVQVPLIMRWRGRIEEGRQVEAPVSLLDLAPTFLAAAQLQPSPDMNGENLLPTLSTGGEDRSLRGWAITGREVHANTARAGNLPYPSRALRTRDHLLIVNFAPDRWPTGDPLHLAEGGPRPGFDELCQNTRITYADLDAGPTKAWLIGQRDNPVWKERYDWAFGKRPGIELYDVRADPNQMKNLADDPEHKEILETLRRQLMEELRANEDPRIMDAAFDRVPYLDTKQKAGRG